MTEPAQAPIRILSFDGGGVGGIIPARLLQRLAQRHAGLLEKTDIFAGTSTGGLIAICLAKGASTDDIVKIYLNNSERIFGWNTRRWQVQSVLEASYNTSGLEAVIRENVPDSMTLKDLTKPVFIPTTAMQRPDRAHNPAGVFLSTVYKKFGKPEMEKYHSGDWTCRDAAMATSAAPTYFPAHIVKDIDTARNGKDWILWDGGMVANNPGLAVYGEVMRFTQPTQPDVRILSFGTSYLDLDIQAGDWGWARAARPVISTLMDASVGSTNFYLEQLLGTKIKRVTPRMTSSWNMDDASAVPRLDNDAKEFSIEDALEWLKKNWSDESPS